MRALIAVALLAGCEGPVTPEDPVREGATHHDDTGDLGVPDTTGGSDDPTSVDTDTATPKPIGPAYADVVVDAPGAGKLPFRDPELAVNGVRGGGWNEGGLDVFSLGYDIGADDVIVLAWSGRRVVDGPGDDLVVFENPFEVSPGNHFMDPAVVFVSPDGADWVAFPHDYVAPNEAMYSTNPEHWQGFAGVTPVLLHADDPVDPFVQADAGGDAFDLADLPAGDPVADRVRTQGVSQIKIISAAALDNPDTGAPWVADLVSNGSDVDGVYARYFEYE